MARHRIRRQLSFHSRYGRVGRRDGDLPASPRPSVAGLIPASDLRPLR